MDDCSTWSDQLDFVTSFWTDTPFSIASVGSLASSTLDACFRPAVRAEGLGA